MSSAFTTYSSGIVKTLKNQATVKCNNKTTDVIALWDTGATSTCISLDVVNQLQLIPDGDIEIKTPSGISKQHTYLVDVILPNNVTIPDLMVIDSAIGSQGIGMLIGMDIITKGDFSVSNYDGKTVFSFRMPSQKKTDFVQEIRIEKLVGQKHGQGKRKHK